MITQRIYSGIEGRPCHYGDGKGEYKIRPYVMVEMDGRDESRPYEAGMLITYSTSAPSQREGLAIGFSPPSLEERE